MLELSSSIISLPGLGKKTVHKLNSIGIHNLEDLLFHLPIRYQNKTKITSLTHAQVGSEILVELNIDRVEELSSRQRQLVCYLNDDSNRNMLIRFFHFNYSQKQALTRGAVIQCFGEVKITRTGLEMHHPEYRVISKGQKSLLDNTLSPIYPLTAGIYQSQLKKWINAALEVLQQANMDSFFDELIGNNMPNLKTALKILHHPSVEEDIEQILGFTHTAQQRLIVEELCAHRLSLLRAKEQRATKKSNSFVINVKLANKLLAALEFDLTSAQKRSIDEINADLSKPQPMLRLLQGDVGSGKTIVAVFSCLQAIENGFQTAIMAPTEILANQHLQGFTNYLQHLGVNIAFVSGSQTAKERASQLDKISSGEAQIAIGTHALFQDAVVFNKLGLVIIDEQHKFGVHQRLELNKKAHNVAHQLVLSATPIPRSLTMSAYADLDVSVIDELPPGRKEITTIAIKSERKDEVITKIKQVCANNNQVYWVCTLIEESENMRAESAKNSYQYLQQSLPDLSVMLIHGKMHKHDKSQIMTDFVNKKIDILVATTVIEVGVNVVSASLMVIENAERLGLAQLHQLRGRVGRGSDSSICILIYTSPLSDNAVQRINILRKTNDGFVIAQKDLALRGPGEILGTKQTGVANMKIANIVRDDYLLKQVHYYTSKIIKLTHAKQQLLINRWIDDEKYKYVET